MRITREPYLLLIIIASSGFLYAQSTQKPGNWETLKLRYHKPTEFKDFPAALPLGNGRLGAKIYGQVESEVLNMN